MWHFQVHLKNIYLSLFFLQILRACLHQLEQGCWCLGGGEGWGIPITLEIYWFSPRGPFFVVSLVVMIVSLFLRIAHLWYITHILPLDLHSRLPLPFTSFHFYFVYCTMKIRYWLLMTLANIFLALFSGFKHALPWVMVLLDTLFLVGRTYEVEAACRRKYGASWESYTSRVRYRLIPRVF